jgi:hypothetical protein
MITRAFYEQVTGVKVCFGFFLSQGLLLHLLWSRRMLFSTGFYSHSR